MSHLFHYDGFFYLLTGGVFLIVGFLACLYSLIKLKKLDKMEFDTYEGSQEESSEKNQTESIDPDETELLDEQKR